jgi:hypothetical protein
MTRYIAKPVSRKANLTMGQATRAVRAWIAEEARAAIAARAS